VVGPGIELGWIELKDGTPTAVPAGHELAEQIVYVVNVVNEGIVDSIGLY